MYNQSEHLRIVWNNTIGEDNRIDEAHIRVCSCLPEVDCDRQSRACDSGFKVQCDERIDDLRAV